MPHHSSFRPTGNMSVTSKKALFHVAYKGSLGVLKVLVFSPVGPRLHMAVVLRYAVKQSHLALAKYLIEEGEVNVMAHFPPAIVGTGCCSKDRLEKCVAEVCCREEKFVSSVLNHRKGRSLT
jgi:hypothetical protein